MNFLKLFIVFLIINFSALGLGSWLMGDGSKSSWYQNLSKAPWTPDGWVFGAAWATVMITFAAYMAFLYNSKIDRTDLIILYIFQFVFNVSWNLVFFKLHQTQIALFVIFSLLVIITLFFFKFYNTLGVKSLLIMPYFIWLLIATSLNAYIVFKN